MSREAGPDAGAEVPQGPGPDPAGGVQIQFAVDDHGVADAIVEELLGRHLIACGQRIGPMTSRFWWDGTIQSAQEWLVQCKTRASLVDRAVELVARRHPYDTPEVVVLPLIGGDPRYLAWVRSSTLAGQER